METLTEDRSRPAEAIRPADGTGQRVSLRRLFWIFFIASFLGANIETAFMLLTRGELQNRSGVLFGTFSLVWGFGAVLFTLCFRRFQGRGGVRVLLGGALVGAGYEYLCSWLQEVLFGACFWDYSHLPFNLHGRVCLVFSLLWGVAALVWVRRIYPWLERWIDRIPARTVGPLTRVLAVFMAANIALTAAALGRMDERQRDLPPSSGAERLLDRYFPDKTLHRCFPAWCMWGRRRIGKPHFPLKSGSFAFHMAQSRPITRR